MKTKNSTFPIINSILGYAFFLYVSFALPAYASHVTLAWNPNSESDLAGYKVYYQAGSSLISGGAKTAAAINVPLAALNDAANPQLTVSGLDETASYFFVVAAYNSEGLEGGFSNEIAYESDPIPDRMIDFVTATNIQMGIQIDDGGNLIRLSPLGSAEIPGSQSHRFPYGIIDIGLTVATPGNAAVMTFYLPESLPKEQSVFAYTEKGDWQNLDPNASFNASRTQVTLTMLDGGSGDSGGTANGEISGIIALGSLETSGISPAPVPPAHIGDPGTSDGGGGGGGCFIAAVTPSSKGLDPVFRMRGFRASLAGLAIMMFLFAGWIFFKRSRLFSNRMEQGRI